MRMEGRPKAIEIPDIDFETRRIKAEELYKSLEKIYCPYLKSDVYINSKGLEHIKFKARDKARNRFDQYIRFKLINLVPKIIGASHTVQGVWETASWESIKSHGRWEKKLQPVNYYEFVAVIGRTRLKVIVKRVAGGHPFFWSLIPFWKMNEETRQRRLHDGDPEVD